jgi:ribonuclease VapC
VVIDTSAFAAILFAEPDAGAFEEAIAADAIRLVSAPTLVETRIVVEARLGQAGARELDHLIQHAAIDVAAFTPVQADAARLAWRRFGKGRHPAGLNLGDCFSYALSKVSGEALLFKGDDFARTDVRSARAG